MLLFHGARVRQSSVRVRAACSTTRALEPARPPPPLTYPSSISRLAAEGRLHLCHQVGVEHLHRRAEGRAMCGGGARYTLLQRGSQVEPSHRVEACAINEHTCACIQQMPVSQAPHAGEHYGRTRRLERQSKLRMLVSEASLVRGRGGLGLE